MKKFNYTKWLIESKHNESMFSKGDEFEEEEVELPGLSEKSLKQKIQELSLDQKAKLYFMGLVRKGKIDTLPEDPKAAYVSMMMDKDDYGRSISGKDKRTFMEPEDSMPAARARKLSGMEDDPRMDPAIRSDFDDPVFEDLKEIASELGYLNENQPTVFDDESMDELLDIILKYVEDPDDAYDELDRFEDGGFDALSNMVAANLDRDPEYKAWYNKLHSIQEPEDLRLEPEEEDSYRDMIKGKYSDDDLRLEPEDDEYEDGTPFYDDDEDLRLEPELDENINESVNISYTDPGFRFYKMKVDGKRLNREEGTEYLKGLGIDMEIPRSYNETTLDKIVAKLKEKGIDADHDAAMDVS